MAGEVAIRPLEKPDELRACEDLQREVWGYTEREVVPKNELLAAVRSGGSLLGAYEDGALVAFAYGMAGFERPRPFLSSRLVAVRDGLRSRGLGERLKRAQRDHALELGYEQIRWTQDPLQAANARLNFRKLGATSAKYVLDYYGQTSSPLHGALPTDRLELVWAIASPAVRRRMGELPGVDPDEVPPASDAASVLDALPPTRADGPPRPGEPREPPAGVARLFLSVPPSLGKCLEHDPELARAWRLASRTAFQTAFARGFAVVDFVSTKKSDTTPEEARYVLATGGPSR